MNDQLNLNLDQLLALLGRKEAENHALRLVCAQLQAQLAQLTQDAQSKHDPAPARKG